MNNSIYSLLIIKGMIVTAIADSLMVSHLQLIGISIGLAMMITSLLVLFVNNHEALMECDAPGARIYQRLMITVGTSQTKVSAS